MGISRFFEETLGANFANNRWSWGAECPDLHRLFLRVWIDQLREVGDSRSFVLLDDKWNFRSPGLNERKRHVQLMAEGAIGFGVVCTSRPGPDHGKTIETFDRERLVEFAGIDKVGSIHYGVVSRTVSVDELRRTPTHNSRLVQELGGLLKRRPVTTESQQLIQARVGQGGFRQQVLRQWGFKCAATGTEILEAVRASHIKPWRDSSHVERLDPDNGLPLVATYDALFDAGWISFRDDGDLLIADGLVGDELVRLGMRSNRLTSSPTNQTKRYLEFHRSKVFRGN